MFPLFLPIHKLIIIFLLIYAIVRTGFYERNHMITLVNNLTAMNSGRMLDINCRKQAKSTEKLSSGFRINRAADDAAGLSISEKMRRQIRGLTTGVNNVQDGVSICQVADGALAEVHDMLNRINELSIQAANGTMAESDRLAVQDEVSRILAEISRIGASTTFNEIYIFARGSGEERQRKVDIDLIRSPSASEGYLYEVYREGNLYYPSASMDFSGLEDTSQINRLEGRSFSFTCSQSCPETFTFTFVNGDGTQSKFLNPESKGKSEEHKYQIDTMGTGSGAEVLDRLFDFVREHPATNEKPLQGGGVKVSHSNILIKTGDNTLVLRASIGYGTREQALRYCESHKKSNSKYGKADFSKVANATDEIIENILHIHYGADARDIMRLRIEKMNTTALGLNDLSVRSQKECYKAINKITEAVKIINRQRELIGAQQNRLESTIDNENNVVENLSASESRIRDTDMAKEIVKNSVMNILTQAGQAVLAHTNQDRMGVLALLD